MTTFGFIKDVLEGLSYLTVLLGVPIAILQYYRVTKKEQVDREYGTYHALDEKYIEFQRLCLAHPYLDVFDRLDNNPVELNELQKKEELIAFTILISIFERAYLMYYDESTELKAKQWSGWDEYIKAYCQRENFKRAWRFSGDTFDTEFTAYMAGIIGPPGDVGTHEREASTA